MSTWEYNYVPSVKIAYVCFEDTHYDGSGQAKVHGVYSTREKAEACAGRVLMSGDSSDRVSVLEFSLDDVQSEPSE